MIKGPQIIKHKYKNNFVWITIKCRLITLDSDNGSAASGLTGTHDAYFAAIPVKGKAIYILNFTKNDKRAETKAQFIEILKGLSVKNETDKKILRLRTKNK